MGCIVIFITDYYYVYVDLSFSSGFNVVVYTHTHTFFLFLSVVSHPATQVVSIDFFFK